MKTIKFISKCSLIMVVLLLQYCAKKNAHEDHKMVDVNTVTESDLLDVSASTNRFVISNQRTVRPVRSTDQDAISAEGYVSEDIRRNLKVSTRISGRIEKLFIRYNYQFVKKGEKIMDIYSPDLNTYLEEYLFLKKAGDSSLIENAKHKLQLLGIHEAQLAQVQTQDSVGLTIEILSPSEGYIIFDSSPAVTKTSAQPSDEMGGMTSAARGTSSFAAEGRIREGTYVNAGETLFKVNDFKEVWAVLSFHVTVQSFIHQGLPVALYSELLPTDTLHGNIDFIEPLYETDQTFLRARVYLDNARLDLKPNSVLTADVFPSKPSRLMLPQSSIFHLGKQNIAWIKTSMTQEGNSIFKAKLISIGAELNGFVEIISGIGTEDEVARDAGYLMDSQSIVIPK